MAAGDGKKAKGRHGGCRSYEKSCKEAGGRPCRVDDGQLDGTAIRIPSVRRSSEGAKNPYRTKRERRGGAHEIKASV